MKEDKLDVTAALRKREHAFLPSNRLSRTPQPLVGYPRRGGLRKGCIATPAGKKCRAHQYVPATTFRVDGTARD